MALMAALAAVLVPASVVASRFALADEAIAALSSPDESADLILDQQ
jgi:hypothetical protein